MPSHAAPATESAGDHVVDIDWLSHDSCSATCDERKIQSEKDVVALELMRDELMLAQKETILQGILNMNKDLRKLSVDEFNKTHKCDIIEAIKKLMTENDFNASGKKRLRNIVGDTASTTDVGFKTPADKIGVPRSLGTGRIVRKGERVFTYSQNGSPVEKFNEGDVVVTAKKRRADHDSNLYPISIGIDAGNGECIDLSDPNERRKLDNERKAQAMQQIMAMQEQMKNLMADW